MTLTNTPTAAPTDAEMEQMARSALWLRSAAGVMSGVLRIWLDKTGLKVRDVHGESVNHYAAAAPGWTDGKDVFLNTSVLVPTIARLGVERSLPSLKGLVCHEGAHILYTPDWNSVRALANYNSGTMMAFNILEDQRIERLWIARYPHTRGYFVNLVADFLLDETGTPSERAHVLLYGRDYLSKSLRRTARRLFVKGSLGQHVTEVEQIISEFSKLVLPRQTQRGVNLAKRLSDILWPTNQDVREESRENPTGEGVGDHPTGSGENNKPDEGKQDEDQQEAGDLDDAGDDEPTEGEGQGDSDSDGGTDGEGGGGADTDTDLGGDDGESGSSDGGEAGDSEPGESEGGTGDGEAGDDGEADKGESGNSKGDEAGEGSSTGDGTKGGESGDDLREAAEQERESLKDDDEYQRDLEETTKDIRGQLNGRKQQSGLSSAGTGMYLPAAGEPLVASQHTRRVLRELQDYVQPGWERQMESGRLNPDAYLRRQPGSTDFFDQWNPGRERDASAEVVVMIDTSGSMSGDPIRQASQAMWTIKSSMDALRIPCTVMAFSDEGSIVYRRDERTQPNKYRNLIPLGGTNPVSSLDESLNILGHSTAKSRLMFIIGDGDFESADACAERVAMHNALGITTCYVGIGPTGEACGLNYRYYGCRIHGNVVAARQIPALIRRAVQTAIARRIGL